MTESFLRGRDAVIGFPLDVDGLRTRVLSSVTGAGRPVVCLHGAGSRADRFTPVVPHLSAAGFAVYALDLPGHGFADKPADFTYSARGLADFVNRALEHLGLEDVVLIGTSLGGHVAAHVALTSPRVGDLVLVGCVGVAPLPEENLTAPAVMAQATPEDVVRKLTGFVLADPTLVTPAWVREESAINSSAGAAEALLAVGRFLRHDVNDDLVADRLVAAGRDRGALVVWGEQDRWTPLSMGHAVRDALPGASWATMPGCGHAPYFEDPEHFAALVVDHLDRPSAPHRSTEE